MHISCERNLLKNAIDQVSKAISTKQALPILGHILFEASDSNLKLTASSLDIGISCTIPVSEMRDGGATTCSAKVIAEIINNLPAGLVNLDIDSSINAELTVSNDYSTFKVMTLPSEEFPKSIKPENCHQIEMSAETFCQIVNKVIPAVADPNEARPIMQGVSITFEPQEIVLAATDSKRLAKTTLGGLHNEGERQQIIVPGKPLNDLLKILNREEEIKISYTANHLFVNSEDMSFFCKLLEGSFPNYEKVIPTSFKSTCRVGKEILTAAIRRVIIMAKDKDVPNLVKFEFQEGNLILSAETNSLGSAEEKLPTIYEGEPLVISFNGNYILDALKVIDQEEILFQLQDSKSSIIIKGDDEDDTSLYICMPVRTR